MKKRGFLMALPAMVLVFGMAFIGCDNGNGDNGDNSDNGGNGGNSGDPTPTAYYVITQSDAAFSVKKGATLAEATTDLATAQGKATIQEAIDAIRSDANGASIGIQFGDGDDTLSLGNAGASFTGNWGYLTITGKITGAFSTTPYATVQFNDGVSGSLNADVATTISSATAIRKEGSGTITISEGTVAGGTGSGYGVEILRGTDNTASGSLIVSGGTITGSTGVDIGNSGSLTVTGGTITGSGTGVLTYTTSNTVTISGGTVSATSSNGSAIRDMGPSTFILSGNAVITSANSQTSGDSQGTIRLWYSTSEAQVTNRTVLEIGPNVTITNTSGGVEIYNPREHKVVDNRNGD